MVQASLGRCLSVCATTYHKLYGNWLIKTLVILANNNNIAYARASILNQTFQNKHRFHVKSTLILAFCKDANLLISIDGASHYVACMQLNIEIDYSKLLNEFRSKGRLLRANYYTILIDMAEKFSHTRPLVDWLAYICHENSERIYRHRRTQKVRRKYGLRCHYWCFRPCSIFGTHSPLHRKG